MCRCEHLSKAQQFLTLNMKKNHIFAESIAVLKYGNRTTSNNGYWFRVPIDPDWCLIQLALPSPFRCRCLGAIFIRQRLCRDFFLLPNCLHDPCTHAHVALRALSHYLAKTNFEQQQSRRLISQLSLVVYVYAAEIVGKQSNNGETHTHTERERAWRDP